MASIRVPPNCSGLTVPSGAQVAVGGVVSGLTAAEVTNICGSKPFPGSIPVQSTAANGDVIMKINPTISSITINSIVYPVTAGVLGPVPAQDASDFMLGMKNSACRFQLVSG